MFLKIQRVCRKCKLLLFTTSTHYKNENFTMGSNKMFWNVCHNLSTLRCPIFCYVKDGGIANKIFSLKKRQIYHHLF